jgi:predicted O-methyltransferase YrrM
MPVAPSIYDLTVNAFAAYDFSRPLFVQASRPQQFDETLDVLHNRLGLSRNNSTLLTTATYPRRPWDVSRHIVRRDDWLSERTPDLTPIDWEAFSVVVVTTTIALGDRYGAMRYQGNLACFCHVLEPIPSVLVNAEGQVVSARRLFEIVERRVGGVTLTGNIQISERETQALYDAALVRQAGQVVEVGRFSGGTAMVLAAAGRACQRPGMTSIDIERLPAAEYFFRANELADDIALLHGDSLALAARWGAEMSEPDIGLLFVDADHSYDAVARDLAAWTPAVLNGGTVVLHDVGSPDCGVARAVYYHLANRADFSGFRQVDSMLFCERRTGEAI